MTFLYNVMGALRAAWTFFWGLKRNCCQNVGKKFRFLLYREYRSETHISEIAIHDASMLSLSKAAITLCNRGTQSAIPGPTSSLRAIYCNSSPTLLNIRSSMDGTHSLCFHKPSREFPSPYIPKLETYCWAEYCLPALLCDG